MKFKGTKGRWNYVEHDYGTHSDFEIKSDSSNHHLLIRTRNDIGRNNKANIRLVCKAPEMLDFINRISGEMLRNDFVLDERWYDQARELIKSATELKEE